MKKSTRFYRQEMIPEIGKSGMEKLRNSHVMMIGMGGGGCAGAHQFAMINIGNLILCDHDTVSESNLGRQYLYKSEDIGEYKVVAAKKSLLTMNPYINIETIPQKISYDILDAYHSKYPDLCLFLAVDKWKVQLEVNKYCIEKRIPCVHMGSMGFKGFVYNFQPKETPVCLKCIITMMTGDAFALQKIDEQEYSYFSPSISVVSSFGVIEIAKRILNIKGKSSANKLMIYRGVDSVDIFDRLPRQTSFFEEVKLSENPKCPLCNINNIG